MTKSKLSAEDYLNKKLRPIFNSMTESIIKENPEDPVYFMINWLYNYIGHSNAFSQSSEKKELQDLRKEIKRLQKKFEGKDDEEMIVQSQESEHSNDEEDDKVEELIEAKKKKAAQKGGRSSVSAEVYGMFNQKKAFEPKVVPKTEDQMARIQDKVLKSFIFNNLDEKELKICLDAMEENVCKSGDYVIKQGDAGAVMYILESGTYDCYKQFAKDQEPVKVKEYFPGDSFGELALLYNAPRAASIVATSDGVMWSLDRETFNNIVKEAAVKKRERYEEFLKTVEILKQIEPYELSQIIDALKPVKVKAGEYVIKQGESGDEFYILEEGEAYAEKTFEGKTTPEKVMDYNKGSYFGELALLKGEPRAASVVAKTDCTLISLERKAFKRLLGPIDVILKRNADSYQKFCQN